MQITVEPSRSPENINKRECAPLQEHSSYYKLSSLPKDLGFLEEKLSLNQFLVMQYLRNLKNSVKKGSKE